MQMFGQFAEEYGPEAVETGLEIAIRRKGRAKPEFVPSPEEFESAIRKAKYAPKLGPAKKSCPFCFGDGWKQVAPRTVVVCDCRIIKLAARESEAQ